jgi:hypothetical protein
MRRDSLHDKLSHRPTAEELIKGGVLHEDPTSVDDLYTERIEEEYAKREGGAWLQGIIAETKVPDEAKDLMKQNDSLVS